MWHLSHKNLLFDMSPSVEYELHQYVCQTWGQNNNIGNGKAFGKQMDTIEE